MAANWTTIGVELLMKRLTLPLLAGFAAVLIAALFLAPRALAQRYTSPAASASAVIGGDHITIDYYAPSMHGRKVMGVLVPYGEVWCTGANWATKITTEADLDINGMKVPKGSYSIWTLPNEKQWMLIVNKQTGQFHLDYDETQDFGRVKMNLKTISPPVETFKIQIESATPNPSANKGMLSLLWETTDAWVPITVLR
jgi:hypothetical protein